MPNLQKAGIVSFAIGVILFLGRGYLGWGVSQLSLLLTSQGQLEEAVFEVALLFLWSSGLVLVVAGSIMFFAGRRKAKAFVSAS